MQLAFMGTPEFAVPALRALLAAGHDMLVVYSQPPAKGGRGRKLRPSPVHAFAEDQGIEVRTPKSMRKSSVIDEFCEAELDAAIVAAYGLILPSRVLAHPKFGCINVHASLLPRWRGAAPINRAIMAGDTETGVSIMKMEKGLDTGPVYVSEKVSITAETTAGRLHDQLADLGSKLTLDVLAGLDAGTVEPTSQPEHGATYADKIDKAEGIIDWSEPAEKVDCRIRGLSPFPGAWFTIDGTRFKALNSCKVHVSHGKAAGTILDDKLTIACNDGAVQILSLQRAGKGPMEAAEFLRGLPVPAGATAA